jgi:hypothetical protein
MAAIESLMAKIGGRAASYVGRVAVEKVRRQAMLDKATALIDRATFEAFLTSLTAAQGSEFLAFLESPQFEHLALRTTVWHLAGRSDEDLVDIRQSARLSLKKRLELADGQLLTGVDMVIHLLTIASEAAIRAHKSIDSKFAVGVVADLAVASARHHELLEGLSDFRAIDLFTRTLRAQVGSTKAKMRLAHLGRRGGIEYADLHVDPTFHFGGEDASRSAIEALDQFQRVVLLGDPGAGKSTFATKLAYDLATDGLPGFEGRVPFLVIAREYAEALRTTRRPFVALLTDVAKDPYNVTPPADAVEYLLLNGAAFVVIDGIDELGDAEARRRLAELIEAFSHHYPLVNIVATSRIVGYDEAAFDHDLFAAIRIAPFSDEQIADYARSWFALECEQGLVDSFLAESADVPDLRSNPLVLSLLCSLYESRHYIPPNRAQIYENCAEMLFERWDQSRGMTVPMRFGTHMRPAVAWLAWLMFTDPTAGQVFSRERVSELLIEYMLEERFDDWTDAVTAAMEFLDYCAGRAWLLTEMGVRKGQRVYGFTHRTFLEYFTAVHLVRLGPSPEQVWERLKDRIADASWRTVANLSVHRLERDCHGGGNGFMELLLDAAVTSPHRSTYLDFGADVAAQIGLRSATLRRLALECVSLAGVQSSRMRYQYDWTDSGLELLRDADRPLGALLQVDLPENVARLGSAIAEALQDPQFDAANDSFSFGFIGGMFLALQPWTSPAPVGDHFLRQPGLLGFAPIRRWANRFEQLSRVDVLKYGGRVLFKQANFGLRRARSWAARLLDAAITDSRSDQVDLTILEHIYWPLVNDPWPWIRTRDDNGPAIWAPSEEGRDLVPRLDVRRFHALKPKQRSTVLLLLIAMIEHSEGNEFEGPAAPFLAIHDARKTGWGRAAAIAQISTWGLLPEAFDLTVLWINNGASPTRHIR